MVVQNRPQQEEASEPHECNYKLTVDIETTAMPVRFHIEVIIGNREKTKYEHLQAKPRIRQVVFLFDTRLVLFFKALAV